MWDSQWDNGFAPSRGVQCLVAVYVLAAKLRRAHGERLSCCDEQSSPTTTSHKKRPHKRSKHQADREQHEPIRQNSIWKRSRADATPYPITKSTYPQLNRLQSGVKSYEKIQQYTIIWRGLRKEFYRAIVAGKAAKRELRIPARCYNEAAGLCPPCFSGFRKSSRHLCGCCVWAIEEGYIGSRILINKYRRTRASDIQHPQTLYTSCVERRHFTTPSGIEGYAK